MSVQESPETSRLLANDRRKHVRFRFVAPVEIIRSEGASQQGLTIEISDGGMSLATDETLQIGERVELDPVIDGKVSAIVRHKQGRIYGLEFVNLSTEHLSLIRTTCRHLPFFSARSLNI